MTKYLSPPSEESECVSGGNVDDRYCAIDTRQTACLAKQGRHKEGAHTGHRPENVEEHFLTCRADIYELDIPTHTYCIDIRQHGP